MDSCCGWSDAALIIPYQLYRLYGDCDVLKTFYPMMKHWMDYVQRQAEEHVSSAFARKKKKTPREIEDQKYLWNTGWHFGDWLIPSQSKSMMGATKSGKLTKEIVASMYYAYDTSLMAEISDILGNKEEAEKYSYLHDRIREAFIRTYVSPEDRMKPDLQGVYVLALWFDLIPENMEKAVTEHLVDMIRKNNGCLDTGFQKIVICPDPDKTLTSASGAYESVYGRISSE